MSIVIPPEVEIWQGDIFALVPWSVVSTLAFVQSTGNPAKPYVNAVPPNAGAKQQLMTKAGRDRAMLISHECIVDKGGLAPLAFARVLSIDSAKADQQIKIRDGSNLQTFHLPATENVLDESYVDFRLLTALAPEMLPGLQRLSSLTAQGRDSLREQLIRYWTRRDTTFPT